MVALLDNSVILGQVTNLSGCQIPSTGKMKTLESMTFEHSFLIYESKIPWFGVMCRHNDPLLNSKDSLS